MEQAITGTNIFDDIQRRIILKEIIDSFCKKGYVINEVSFIEFNENKISVKIIMLDGNKLMVEKDLSKINWKLNALPMGQVIGKDIADVAFSYDYEKAKDR